MIPILFVVLLTFLQAQDPISGTWSGTLTPNGSASGVRVTFQLKFDGKSAVTGTFSGLPNPGDVKTGTFDSKTGKLKLHLGKTGETSVLLVLEGIVANGAVSGQVSGEVSGEFKLEKKRIILR
jgi:hypothetical protein